MPHASSTQELTTIVTGGTGGIGLHTAVGLVRAGHRVIIVGRNAERAEAARERIVDASRAGSVEVARADVSTKAGVEGLAAGLLRRFPRIDVLVNNAGYLGAEHELTVDGFEKHFAVNVAAPYWLTRALLPALQTGAPSRVVNVTGGQARTAVDVTNLQAEKGFKGLMTYSHAKSAMEAMSLALAEELAPKGTYVNVIYPGVAATAMTGAMSAATLPGPMKLLWPFFKAFFQRDDDGKSAAKASRASVWAATAPELEGVSGMFFQANLKPAKLHKTVRDKRNQRAVIALIESVTSSAPALDE